MAISIDELISRMEGALKDLDATREANALIKSGETLALIKRRIQQRRVDANGDKLGQYSTKKVPFWFFRNKPTLGNPDAKVKELYRRFGYFASYYEWKVVNNQSNPDINLTFTGRMMNSLRPAVIGRTRNAVQVSWIAGSADEAEKFEYAVDRFPVAFQLSDDEKKVIEDANRERVNNVLSRIFQ